MFSGRESAQRPNGPDVITFYYPDYTVGFGISPNHARFLRCPFPKGEIVTAQRGSWALPPIGNSNAHGANVTLPRRFIRLFGRMLCFDDAVHRADFNTLGRIEVTFALDTGDGVNHVDVTIGDGIGGAFRKAGAAGNAVFEDFHSHGIVSP
jgi:hypothetical protein